MTALINVKKRNGNLEPVDLEKIHRVVEWAAEGLDVSVSEVEMKSHIQMYDGISTADIHATLTKSAADLISAETPDYQYMAARLAIYNIRKKAFGDYLPPSLCHQINFLTSIGKYDMELRTKYNDLELIELDNYIDHERDFNLAYAGVMQLEGKYLVKNRVTGQLYESPQFIYMLVPMALFADHSDRINLIKRFYDAVSLQKISLPTPIMSGLRTPTRQFSSCVLIEASDDLDGINAASSAIVKYVSQKAGIGLNAGMIRALGSEIRGGDARHTGLIPFYKHFQTAVKSCSQGGVRGGAATVFYPLWHLEVENLLVLKNNRGVDENRVRHLDYGVQFNKLMYQRLIRGENITLFSPSDVEGLYEAFFADQEKFEELYTKYESDPSIRKKSIKAVELFTLFASERASTGRIYLQNVDHCNTHSPFDPKVAPVKQSNLCVVGETLILTDKGYKEIQTLEGQNVNVWNGEEWSNVLVSKTGVNQETIKVVTYGGEITCTPYHKFYLHDGVEVRASDLEQGDELEGWFNPDTGEAAEKDYVMHITEGQTGVDTFCVNEPKRHKVVFNGILTGNCLEIALPTKPLKHVFDEDGEIALCTLAAFNLGKLDKLDELEDLADLVVRALDSLLDYQNYPLPAAEKNKKRRTLGVGVVNYANMLAKHGVKYSDGSANNLTHRTFEAIQFYLLKASMNLAKEVGACEYFNETTYSQGILPIDTYKKDVDSIVTEPLHLDWEWLRGEIVKNGLRNSTLSALMPSETSSQVSNATNGIEPPRGLVSTKLSKDGVLKQVVPDIETLRNSYELLWTISNNTGYLQLVSIMQKFVDQTISANTNYDPRNFADGKVSMQQVLKDLLTAYKLGVKTLYYHNTRDGSEDQVEMEDESCASGACKI
jgi:ribonucleotide reductase alpha subunit